MQHNIIPFLNDLIVALDREKNPLFRELVGAPESGN